ncbi:MAG: helix-turn-helix transcriptional regulator [Firmicutes bacterium]|nr:helix-turn-helix transcriptional regulator [Bacillota bacterium]
MLFAERLKELRQERNLSQTALAQIIGVSQKAIDYWERAINEPKATYIIRLADYFDISADYLLGREN